jgi:hypothetical protein
LSRAAGTDAVVRSRGWEVLGSMLTTLNRLVEDLGSAGDASRDD